MEPSYTNPRNYLGIAIALFVFFLLIGVAAMAFRKPLKDARARGIDTRTQSRAMVRETRAESKAEARETRVNARALNKVTRACRKQCRSVKRTNRANCIDACVKDKAALYT